MTETNETIGQIVKKAEQNFISGNGVLTSKYVTTDLYTDINTIYAYLESKHISGSTDSLGRDKPFFNIVISARNVWYRATDIDRKNIKVKPTKEGDIFGSFLATIKLQDWMRRNNFGMFLNIWGLELSSFNSAVVKFVEKGNTLIPSVVPWSRLIVDQVNFKDNPKIELLELTESQLRDRGYSKEAIKNMIDSNRARELTSRQKKDNKNNYYKLYEVHGVFPLSFLTGNDKDDETYCQQMHVLSFLYNKKEDKYDDFCLYKGKEENDPYMITCLLPESDGSISMNGAVKNLFEAQWIQNHTAKSIKDQLDLASKLIFQTSDGNFVGQNALNAIESGDIMIHAMNQPLTQLQNNSHDISALQSYGQQWKALGNEIVGISESMMGNAAPSGTAWRQVEALLQESHSLFELMTENKGLALEEMLRTFVIPYIKKQLNNKEEITAILEEHQLTKIDAKYIPVEGNKRLAKKIIATIIDTGEVPQVTEADKQYQMDEVKNELNSQGNQRFFSPDEIENKTWKEVFDGIEWDLEVDITGEQAQNKEDMATLATMFQTVVGLQGRPMSPEEKFIFNKVLTKTGTVSPAELSSLNSSATPMAMPTAGGVGAGQDISNLQ